MCRHTITTRIKASYRIRVSLDNGTLVQNETMFDHFALVEHRAATLAGNALRGHHTLESVEIDRL